VERPPGGQSPVRLAYVLTKSAMTDAARLQNGLAVPAVAGAIMFVVMLITGPWDASPKTPGIYAYLLLFPVFGGLLFFVGFGLLNWFITIPMRSSALVRQNPALFGDMELIEDAESVEIKGARSTTRLRWSEFRGFKENKNIFLLCLSKSVVYPIPKDGLTPEAMDAIRRRWLQRLKPLN
jgi:YcxB-like protein